MRSIIEHDLCHDCSEPPIPGQTRCKKHAMTNRQRRMKYYSEHREIELERFRKRREKYISEGRCPRCSAPLNPDRDGDNVQCLNCNEDTSRRHR